MFSEIFNVEKYRVLEIPVKSQSRSLKVVPFDRLDDFLLVFYSNFVPKAHRFWNFDFKYAVTLKTSLGVRRGHWKCHHSIERVELPINAMGLSHTVSAIDGDFSRKPQNFPTPSTLRLSWRGSPWNWLPALGVKQEAHLMLTTGSTRLAVSRGQQTWYHFRSIATFR